MSKLVLKTCIHEDTAGAQSVNLSILYVCFYIFITFHVLSIP